MKLDSGLFKVALSVAGKGDPSSFIAADFWKSMAFSRETTDPKVFQDPYFQLAQNNFNHFCEGTTHCLVNQETMIPKLLHFIWLGSPLPEENRLVVESWRRWHPEWEIKLWDDQAISQFSWTNNYARFTYEGAITWAERADILRYEILHRYGGVYSDVDIVCLKSFNPLLTASFFACLEDNIRFYLCNALFGVAPGSPVMQFCLDNIVTGDEVPEKKMLDRTGPLLLTRACINNFSEKMLILPCSYFYPFPYMKKARLESIEIDEFKNQFVSEESMAIHLWAETWQ